MWTGALTGGMPPLPRPALIAAVSAAAGTALFGVAAGGVVGVDDDLRAVTPPARFEQVDFRPDVARPELTRPAHDCAADRPPLPSSAPGEV